MDFFLLIFFDPLLVESSNAEPQIQNKSAYGGNVASEEPQIGRTGTQRADYNLF